MKRCYAHVRVHADDVAYGWHPMTMLPPIVTGRSVVPQGAVGVRRYRHSKKAANERSIKITMLGHTVTPLSDFMSWGQCAR